MSKEIYNEGRVVGLSQYEIFVKNWLANTDTKDIDPPSEQEWLASTVGPGSSLLLKMTVNESHGDDEVWIYETHLPEGTNLCGCNPVIASLFIGSGAPGGDAEVWPKYVNSYGDTITNTTNKDIGLVLDPTLENLSYDKELSNYGQLNTLIEQYSKILDGTILQGGTWELNTEKGRYDFKPDLSSNSKSMIRIQIKGKINAEFYILLTGLNYKSTIQGVSGLDGSIDKSGSQNGAYLGPAQYPWACKVLFTLPASYSTAQDSGNHVYVVYGTDDEGVTKAKQLAKSLGEKGLVIYRDSSAIDASGLYSVTQDNEGNYQLYTFGASAVMQQIYIGNNTSISDPSPTVPGTKIITPEGDIFYTFRLPTVGETEPGLPGFQVDPENYRNVDYIRWSDLTQAMHDSLDQYRANTYSSESLWASAVQDGDLYCWSDYLGTYSLLSVVGGSIRDSSGNQVTWSADTAFYKKLPNLMQFKLDVLGSSLRHVKQSLNEESPYIDFNGIRLYVSSEEPVDSFYYKLLSAEEAPTDWLTVKMSDNKYFALRADGQYVPIGQVDPNPSNYTEYKPNTYYEKIADAIPDGSIGIGW